MLESRGCGPVVERDRGGGNDRCRRVAPRDDTFPRLLDCPEGLPPGLGEVDQRLGSQVRLAYPGVGWLVFRDDRQLPEELVFYEDYLGERDASSR
jgi:hypothetical protein